MGAPTTGAEQGSLSCLALRFVKIGINGRLQQNHPTDRQRFFFHLFLSHPAVTGPTTIGINPKRSKGFQSVPITSPVVLPASLSAILPFRTLRLAKVSKVVPLGISKLTFGRIVLPATWLTCSVAGEAVCRGEPATNTSATNASTVASARSGQRGSMLRAGCALMLSLAERDFRQAG